MHKKEETSHFGVLDTLGGMEIWAVFGAVIIVFGLLASWILPYSLYKIVNFLIFVGALGLWWFYISELKWKAIPLCLLLVPIVFWFNPFVSTATSRDEWINLDLMSIVIVLILGVITHIIAYKRQK